jgi:hypothetical protein
MSTANQIPTQAAKDQREALKRSEKNASSAEPQNFRDEENAAKVVTIPSDKENAPIKGMDPDDRRRKAR